MIVVADKVVDWNQLLEVVYTAAGAAIAVAIAFSLVVTGATRFGEHRREARMGVAGVYALLTGLGLAVCGAAIVLGIVSMTAKH
jgi:hypothetical protein